MSHDERERWARLRFAIIGPLLAAPPERGQLGAALRELSVRQWKHPGSGEAVRFGVSTLERWYYAARAAERDPLGALRAKQRTDAGRHRRLAAPLRQALQRQYRAHRGWSMQLHYDNLAALVAGEPALGPLPSYATVRRYYLAQGFRKMAQPRRGATAGLLAAERHLGEREVRSFEVEHVNALWHADAHEGSRRVLGDDGRWHSVHLIGVLDDCSRLCCHAQWYLAEQAETFVHSLSQALQRRSLPRALMTDNGGAETAAEVTEGLARLGIVHQTTLPYSAYQNAKQEVFWARVEGRLMAMLESVEPLSLDMLNNATLAWVEREYNRAEHGELGCAPLTRYLDGPDVARECPHARALRSAFRTAITRKQRLSDGTCTVAGVRFEVPARYRHLRHLSLRTARWDRSCVELLDPNTGESVATLLPLDKRRNAEFARRALVPTAAVEPGEHDHREDHGREQMAPLLKRLLAEYAATGLPPAYLPFEPAASGDDDDNESTP
ncbi:MAG: DDE-type integrase/transposase/recombinase [Gammaproteobacteria bacterium]